MGKLQDKKECGRKIVVVMGAMVVSNAVKQSFLDIRSKTQESFDQNSNFRQIFQKYQKIEPTFNGFCIKSDKIVQKLKNIPKTQRKMSKHLT